jgi:hypothetical protein
VNVSAALSLRLIAVTLSTPVMERPATGRTDECKAASGRRRVITSDPVDRREAVARLSVPPVVVEGI